MKKTPEQEAARAEQIARLLATRESYIPRKQRPDYLRWRATSAVTDEQIIALYERIEQEEQASGEQRILKKSAHWHADRIRKHGATPGDLRYYAQVVPRPCGLCGKPAHYIMGQIGRCREHRNVPTEGFKYHSQVTDQRWRGVETFQKALDQARRTKTDLSQSRRAVDKRRK